MNNYRRPLTLIHAADLHLGSDVYPQEAVKGLDALLQATRQFAPNALLIAGDLFDAQNIPPEIVAHAFSVLGSVACPIVVLPGNHDTLLTSPAFRSAPLPANLHLLLQPQGETVALDGLGLTLWGRPVYDHTPEFRPLQGLGPRPTNGWRVAMAHGLVIDYAGHAGRSSPILPSELAQADCDYIALGHVHQFRQASQSGPPAYYSGAPSGCREPTLALVRLHPQNGVSVTPVRL